MTTEWKEVLERLITLQDLDSRISRLNKRLNRAPRELKGRETTMAGLDVKIKKLVDRTRVLKSQILLREHELKGHENKIQKLKEQASEVRTNKEFVAFRSEIANTQGESDRLQGEILKILDVVEIADSKVAEYQAERQHEVDMGDKARAEIASKLADVSAMRDGLLTERPAMLKGIPKETIEIYEKVYKARGRGMSPLEGAYCSLCGDVQTKNDQYAVQNRTRPVICGACNRILYQP